MTEKKVYSEDVISYLKELGQYVSDNAVSTHATEPTALTEQMPTALCWCKTLNMGPKPLSCSILITGKNFTGTSSTTSIIATQNPKYAIAKIITRFFTPINALQIIHSTAQLSSDIILGHNISIGANCVIEGKGTIGDNTTIHPNVTIKGPITIGQNVEIHPGCVIGYDGFGYAKTDKTEHEKFPHLRGVIIKDHVEIGANSCVDRGVLTDTLIGSHTKIDKACLIAHGAIIGSSCMIAGFTNIGGSVVIGNNTWLSPKSTILNGIQIGHDAFIGIGSVVIRSVKNHHTVFGNPAKVIKKAQPSAEGASK